MKEKLIIIRKISFLFLIALFILAFLSLGFYLYVLPAFLKTNLFETTAKKVVHDILKMELTIKNSNLKTSLKPVIGFSIDRLSLKKDGSILFDIEDFDSEIEFDDIFEKEIDLKSISAKKIFVQFDKILNSFNQTSQKQNLQTNWTLEFDDADIKIDGLFVTHNSNKNLLEINCKNILLKNKKLSYDLRFKVYKNTKNYIDVISSAKEKVSIDKNSLLIDDLDILLNKSKIKIKSKINEKEIVLNAKSSKFLVEDIFKIISSDFIIPEGEMLLSPIVSPAGNLSFDINLNNQNMAGFIKLNNAKVLIKDLSNLPLTVSSGSIGITNEKITFDNLIGYYGKDFNNKAKIYGDIKDYYKTFDSNIIIDTFITNEFFKSYLAKLINTNLHVSKACPTRIVYKSKNNIMDITWLAKINKGINFGVDDSKSTLSDYDRAVKGDFRIIGNNLDIKNINYYIASDIKRGVKLSPILIFDGNMDLTGKINKVGIAFGREMPCEFLNVFAGQKLFKKGTIKGNVHIVFKNNIPVLDADMQIANTFIPTQRMMIKNAILKTDSNMININAQGRFKRATYDFKGKIKNELKAPYVIKNLTLDLDNLDVERFLASVNNQNTNVDVSQLEDAELQDDDYMFDTNLIRIEDCKFSLQNGKYKDLTFGNIKADLTLDENGILDIKSNRFDIAQGISTLKVNCDLKDLKYYLRLGVKDVDSNLMAKTLLNLDKEITGKASGLIELNSDSTMMMNGEIKFLVNEGTIGKIGLVEYLLKIASVFRNPIVMISPATIVDIVSIPEGKFDKITGVLKIKDNVVYSMDIKSYSKSLSALIRGRFDMNLHDASLRIYTRFSNDRNSMFGFLRSFSLNVLANKVQMNSRNDANYYESELKDLPQIDVKEEKSQIFLTQVEGDVEHFNFLSSLKKIK